MKYNLRLLIIAILSLLTMASWSASANDEPLAPEATVEAPAQTPIPPVGITGSEPSTIMMGQTVTITVFGANFTTNTVVRVENVGILTTTFINESALTVELPTTIPTGIYDIEVIDPDRGRATRTDALTVAAEPPPTMAPPPTLAPATPIPGQPSLVARNFSVTPQRVKPGETITLTFELVNQGNYVAQGISVALDSGGAFVPAAGQASATVPDIFPNGTSSVTLRAVASGSATPGAVSIPITMTYRDPLGQTYSQKTSLSATIENVLQAPQIFLARYMVTPNPVKAGEAVTIQVLLTNNGTVTANQVLLRIGTDGVLLAGPQGDSFPYGDLTAADSMALDLPLMVKGDAEAGPQAQPVTITYFQNGEAQTINTSITIEVEASQQAEPIILVNEYDPGVETLLPGQRFTLDLTLENVGDGGANEMFVTFGTVSTGDSSSGSGGGTTTNPGSTFAPLGTGGTLYIGDLEANGFASMTQEFIVSGTIESGIYPLPVTIRYQKPNGTSTQESLSVSLVVIKPAQLSLRARNPIPTEMDAGNAIPLDFRLTNAGTKDVNIVSIEVSAENGEVVDGSSFSPGNVPKTDKTDFSSVVVPLDEGETVITVTITYMDDLNNERQVEETYTVTIYAPPPIIEEPYEPMPPIPEEPIDEQASDDNIIERVIFGLLGLGS